MPEPDLQEGDIVVVKRHTDGSLFIDSNMVEDNQFFITALVTDLDGAFGIEVEFCEPIPIMSALGDERPDHLKAPSNSFKFGDTKSWIDPSDVISHHRPNQNA